MKKALRDKWIAALRGGEYQQTSDVLRDCEGYCCLGVLLDISDEEGDWNEDGHKIGFIYGDNGDEAFPSDSQQEGLGISNELCIEFACMNDSHFSFSAIADKIEEKVLAEKIGGNDA